ncbi:metal ABC transporter ATP-binding protein [Leucothrix sargassi]|nr:metal ABC transporter ATP-binding protein [Leucothrix sargassi]
MITAKNIGLQLEGNVILDDVSFSIKKGEYVGLIGPNGAGKSSLIKLILGLHKATSGSLQIERNTKIGYVPQNYLLSSVVPISVLEVLTMSGIKDKARLVLQLEKVGLASDFLKRNFHRLSGGQQQRVIIARALCCKPNLLVFDEPLNGVDYETKLSIYKLLSELNKNKNLTILFVSHEVDHIVGECNHILCLNRTMHTGCHPLDFAKGIITDCPVLDNVSQTVPVHHHHDEKSSCSC